MFFVLFFYRSNVQAIRLVLDKNTGYSKGFLYIDFLTKIKAVEGLVLLNGLKCLNKDLDINIPEKTRLSSAKVRSKLASVSGMNSLGYWDAVLYIG